MKIKSVLLIAATAMLCTACHDDNYDGKSGVAPTLYGEATPYISGTTDVAWKASQTLGIYLTDATGTTNFNTNAAYTASVAGNTFARFYAKSNIYFPASGESTNVIMYAPYDEAANSSNLIHISTADQSTPMDIDVLYAKSTGHSTTAPNVNFYIKHLLAKIRVKISAEVDGNEVSTEGVTVKLIQITDQATFNVVTEAFTYNTDKSEFAMAMNDSEAYQASAFVIPEAVGDAAFQIYLPIADKTYISKLSDSIEELQSATLYTFQAKLGDAVAKITLESIVNDWEDGNGNGEDIIINE